MGSCVVFKLDLFTNTPHRVAPLPRDAQVLVDALIRNEQFIAALVNKWVPVQAWGPWDGVVSHDGLHGEGTAPAHRCLIGYTHGGLRLRAVDDGWALGWRPWP